MITVEELIVQSLYHRLVLITVRRTPSSNEGGTSDDSSENSRNRGTNSSDALSEAVPLIANDEDMTTTSQGLGYLHLGSFRPLLDPEKCADELSTDAGVLEMKPEPLAAVTLNECLSTSEALIRSLAPEEITIRSKVSAVLDTKDIKVVQRLLKTTEVQTDFEPMWTVERNLLSSSTSCGELSAFQTSTLSSCTGPIIDLRNCDQFSVIHLEDLKNPSSQSVVMVNANEIKQKLDKSVVCIDENEAHLGGKNSESDSKISSSTPNNKFYANSERISSQGALFVEDSMGHLKREYFPVSEEYSRAHSTANPLDVDSGIWDMMQVLESGAGTKILPKVGTNHSSNYCSDHDQSHIPASVKHPVQSPDLHGTYRMFALSHQSKETLPAASEQLHTGSSKDGSSSEYSDAKELMDEIGCGLSDALKPAAAANFVIQRVESEMDHQKTKGSDKSLRRDKNMRRRDRAGSLRNCERIYRRARSLKARRVTKGICQTCKCCNSQAKESQMNRHEIEDMPNDSGGQKAYSELSRLRQDVQSLAQDDFEFRRHQCTCPVAVYQMERGTAAADDDDPEPEQEHYRDVIKLTSLQMNHPHFSTMSSQNLTELGRQFHPWEIVVPPRKSQSEQSSPMSSVTDLQTLGQQHTASQTFERKQHFIRSANASPTRRSLQLSRPIDSTRSQHSVSTETSSTPLSNESMIIEHRGQGSGDWGSGLWSCGTLDSLSTITANCDQLEVEQFEKFPDWMRKLRRELHCIQISELCIPGSHIALAIEKDMKTSWEFSRCNYEMAEFLCKLPNLPVFNNFRDHMKSIWKAWMPKQWLSIHDQLVAGSRYFDLRITKHNDTIFGEHGLYTRQLKKYLKEVRLFTEEQPFEVVILHFQSCEYLDRSDKRHLVTMLFQIFGGKMLCRSNGVLPSLEWMWKMKKQLIIIFAETDMELIKNHIFGALVWSDKIVEVTTPKKQTVSQLVEYLDDSVKKQLDARDMSKLFVCKAVLSPDMSTVFGKFQYHCMRELVLCEISSAVSTWLERQNQLNIVAVDFIGIAGIVQKIIELNDIYLFRDKQL